MSHWALCLGLLPGALAAQPVSRVTVHVKDGDLEGVVSGDGLVRTFKGIPYAAPPVGKLRWQPPQPVEPWTGVRDASAYGPRAMQVHLWDDMFFHDSGPSEDCLYLNLWMPEKPATAKLPVMVWIYGGGFVAGGTSEARQDGGNLCKKGVLVVSMGYRLGAFGFLALPGLTAASPHHASGNYGLLDMVAALHWVHDNIATFGGDPDNVTIFGESAGSFSVSILMASPLAQGLFQRAIGESGAMFGRTLPARSLAEAEASGAKFMQEKLGSASVEALRTKSAQEIMDATAKAPIGSFGLCVDGWFLPSSCTEIYTAGTQSHVPLLAGWNLDEDGYEDLLGQDPPTLSNYRTHVEERFGDKADAFLKVYPATNDAEARRAAADFGSDKFIGYSAWKWIDLQAATGGSPVYRYKFEELMPKPAGAPVGWTPKAYHSCEIEFVFRVLGSKALPFEPRHHQVSELMASYWTNFAKTGNPNGPGLPIWPRYSPRDGYEVMHLSAQPSVAPDLQRGRYEFLDANGMGKN
jgi:para-nitrobenzyl esterase